MFVHDYNATTFVVGRNDDVRVLGSDHSIHCEIVVIFKTNHKKQHLYHSQIRICEMDICYSYTYIEHKNLETRKNTYDFLVQVRNFLLPLSLKVLPHKEWDTHSFYSGFFICPHHISYGTRYKGYWPGFGEQAKANRLLPRQVSTLLLSSKFPKSSARFRWVTSFAQLARFSSGYCDISWVTCPLSGCTREHLR